METVEGLSKLKCPLKNVILTLGNFDGIHLGHQEIVSRVVEHAQDSGSVSVVMTFSPHPRELLRPNDRFQRIFSVRDQEGELEKRGVDFFLLEPFTRELSQLSPESFVTDFLYKNLSPKKIVVGYDFSFGSDRKGNFKTLDELGKKLGFSVEEVAPVELDGEVVSSSRIRNLVQNGDVSRAHRLLGRRFYLEGLVERGDGRGRTIGIPTANLRALADLVPKVGVYATRVIIENESYPSVTNIGVNPTFKVGAEITQRVETHILDFDQDLYGKSIRLEFIDRIRDEMKFEGPEQLVKQIQLDIKRAKDLF